MRFAVEPALPLPRVVKRLSPRERALEVFALSRIWDTEDNCGVLVYLLLADRNVEIVAVSDLFPDRCAELAKVARCATTYPSLEELVKDDRVEAVFVATDAPNHAQHCIEVLQHGKHVATAVPAVYGSLEDAVTAHAGAPCEEADARRRRPLSRCSNRDSPHR